MNDEPLRLVKEQIHGVKRGDILLLTSPSKEYPNNTPGLLNHLYFSYLVNDCICVIRKLFTVDQSNNNVCVPKIL